MGIVTKQVVTHLPLPVIQDYGEQILSGGRVVIIVYVVDIAILPEGWNLQHTHTC